MKIFVLGAGKMGTEVAKDLSRSQVTEIGVGDIEEDKAKKLALQVGGTAFRVDVAKTDELSRILKAYDAVVNASWYEFNLLVMKACFKAGCNYNDLGGMFHMTREQLKLDADARKENVSAVVGGGESPGITNVMAAFASEDLEQVETIKVFAGARESSETQDKELHFPFSISTVIDEYSKMPLEFLNGKYAELPALTGDEVIDFPEPVGRNVCHYCLHSEPATLPASIGRGVKNVEFKIGVSEKMAKTLQPLIELGLTSEKAEIDVNGFKITPKQFLVSFFNSKASKGMNEPGRYVALKTVASGTKNSRQVSVTCDLVAEPRQDAKNATAYLTGMAGSIFGQILASGKVEAGVVPPEMAVKPSIFLEELDRRGVHVKRSTKSE